MYDEKIRNDKYIEWRNKMASKDYKSNLKNLQSTFAIEDMKLSKDIIDSVEKIANNEITYSKLVEVYETEIYENMRRHRNVYPEKLKFTILNVIKILK